MHLVQQKSSFVTTAILEAQHAITMLHVILEIAFEPLLCKDPSLEALYYCTIYFFFLR